MKDCSRVQPLLGEYIDGTLEREAAADLKAHLSGCAVCTHIADEFAQTARLLQLMPREELSANFEDMLARRIADVALRPQRETVMDRLREWWGLPRLRYGFAALATAAALVPAVIFGIGRHETNISAVDSVQRTPTMITAVPEATSLESISEEHLFTEARETLSTSKSL